MCFKGVEGCLPCMNGDVVGPLQLWVLGPLQGGGCAAMQMRGRGDTSFATSLSSTSSVREMRRQGGRRRYLSAEHMYVFRTGRAAAERVCKRGRRLTAERGWRRGKPSESKPLRRCSRVVCKVSCPPALIDPCRLAACSQTSGSGIILYSGSLPAVGRRLCVQ